MSTSLNPMRRQRFRKRLWVNRIALSLSIAAMAFGLFWLFWILFDILYMGAARIDMTALTQVTLPAGRADGGLANAIWGSLLMVGLATLIGTPIGILTGIYLCEYGKEQPLARVIRFINDTLLSAPSIIIGLFVYSLIVVPFHGFSGWAGVVALALIMIPVVVLTTENMLRLVSNTLREAAYALGTPKWKVVSLISLRAARSGIVTGILLAVARISGETAPLLFTSLSNNFWSSDLSQPMASLPVTIFHYALSPSANWQDLAWAGVFLITLSVLVLNLIAHLVVRK